MGNANLNRREVLGGLAALGASSLLSAQDSGMTYHTLGQTGQKVSAVGLGGFHIGKPKLSDEEATRLMRSSIDHGLTFMDNCWDYNAGVSEVRMGNALRDGYRQKVFLMSKVDGRTKAAAASQMDESLKRLQTDHIDLMMAHEILRFDDPDRIFAPGGAIEAFVAAKQAGKIRYIGFTGHKDPQVHLYMLSVADKHGFRFDAVLHPINVMDAHFRSFEKLVYPELVKRNIGTLSMKPFGDTVILKSKTATPMECLQYALYVNKTGTVITGIDNQQVLDQAFEAVRTLGQVTPQQITAILGRTAKAAESGEYELFKTSAHFDSTAFHADWLGDEAPAVKALAPKG